MPNSQLVLSQFFPATKVVGFLAPVVVKHNARSIMKTYKETEVTGLSFLIDTGNNMVPVRMPVKTDQCLEVLVRQKKEHPKSNIKATREQAERVAWRILKDWVEAQMALLDMEMVSFEEIFLSYIELKDGTTVYKKLEQLQFLLEERQNNI